MSALWPRGVETVDLRIRSDPAHLADMREAVRQMAERCGFAADETDAVALAVDEALTNTIKHGYGGSPEGDIDIHLERLAGELGGGLEVRIRDYGHQVDPEGICSRDLSDIRPGGLGVHIMRCVMDELRYERCQGGGMLVTMRKYLTRHGESPVG